MSNDFNTPIIEEFRANHGQVGGWFAGARLLLLTTTGARSGEQRTVPLGFLPDGDDRRMIIASAAGAPKHPAWYHNVLANPLVTVEEGDEKYQAKATVLYGDDRDRAFAHAVEQSPGWGEYQTKTTRIIPVIVLEPVPAGR